MRLDRSGLPNGRVMSEAIRQSLVTGQGAREGGGGVESREERGGLGEAFHRSERDARPGSGESELGAEVNNAEGDEADAAAGSTTAAAERPRGAGGAGGPGGAGGAVEAGAAIHPAVNKLPQYRVLLHNDDIVSMDEVVRSIVQLTPLPRARAYIVMLMAHTRGMALVLITHRERAELYQQQFRAKGLRVTIEPAE